MSAEKRLDDIVLGIIGLGGAGSLGFNVALKAGDLQFVTRVYVNEKDKIEKLGEFKRLVRPENSGKYLVPEDKADVEKFMQDTADKCDVVLLCFDRGMGASKGNMASAPPDVRKRLFDANIDAVVDYARFFGERRSDALFVVCTNPTDALSYFFSKEYWAARKEPERHGNVVGLNHVDTRRYETLVKEALGKVSGVEPDGIYAAMWGPHDVRSFPIISQSSYRRDGKRVKLSETGELSIEVMKVLAAAAKKLPFRILNFFGSTSTDTSYAVEDLLHSIHGEKEICNLSCPVPLSGGIIPFMGLPVRFENGRAVLVGGLIEHLSRDEQADYDRVVRSCRDDLEQLLRRQGEVKAYVIRTSPKSKTAATPKFFKELVIPRKKDGKSWLHFHNFTYPFDDRSEVRPPIRVAGDAAVYIDNVVKGGESQLAVSHTTGVQIVNPRTGRSEDYSLPRTVVAGRKHCNGCCTIDDVVSHERDVVIASVNGEGLLRGRIAGAGSDGSETGTLDQVGGVPDRFKGYVRAHKGRTYYLAGTGVVEAELRSGSIVPLREYSVDCPDLRGAELNNFAIFDTAPPTKADVRDMRVFVSATRPDKYNYLGGVFESVGGKGREVYSVSEASRRARPDVRLVSVEHIFGKYHLAVGSSDKVVLIDMEDPLIKIPVCLSRGNVQSFVTADLFDELDVFAAKNRSTSSPTSYFYRAKFDRKGGKLSLEHCGDGLLDPEESFPFLINHACVYSEFMG